MWYSLFVWKNGNIKIPSKKRNISTLSNIVSFLASQVWLHSTWALPWSLLFLSEYNLATLWQTGNLTLTSHHLVIVGAWSIIFCLSGIEDWFFQLSGGKAWMYTYIYTNWHKNTQMHTQKYFHRFTFVLFKVVTFDCQWTPKRIYNIHLIFVEHLISLYQLARCCVRYKQEREMTLYRAIIGRHVFSFHTASFLLSYMFALFFSLV